MGRRRNGDTSSGSGGIGCGSSGSGSSSSFGKAIESPWWRQAGSPSTCSMLNLIDKSVARFESLPDKKKMSNSLSMLKREMVKDFVFHVAKVEGEGLDSVEEVGEAIDAFEHGQDTTSRFDTAKLMSTLNLYKAVRLVNQWSVANSKLPALDLSMILKLHKILGENTKDHADAGELRSCVAWTLTTDRQKHCYLDPKKIEPAMEQLIRATNESLKHIFGTAAAASDKNYSRPRCSSNLLLNFSASFFYKFESIHPFRDGNGRVGRLLVAYLLSSIMPWGANNLYQQEQEQLEQQHHVRFVDRNIYLMCFQVVQDKARKGDPAPHPAELAALLIEGVYVAWLRYSAKL